MFKLLPEEARARVAGEYKLRRTVMMLTALVVVFAMALIGLFPSYMLSKVKQTEAGALAPASSGKEGEWSIWLLDFNRKLDILSTSAEEEKISAFIEKVIAEKRAGIHLTQFNWKKIGETATLSLKGISDDRQTLLSFESRLKDSGHFSQVTLPVSNLVKERDLGFQIELSVKTP